MIATTTLPFTVTLSEEERQELLRILQATLVETHAETRRTEAPAYQEQMHKQEALLRSLIGKIRG